MNQVPCRCPPNLLQQLGCQCRYAEPAQYQTILQAIDHATTRIIETQSVLIARLTERRRARVTRPDGSSFPANWEGEEPRRPAIGMLFEVLDEVPAPPGVLGMYPASFIPSILPWLRCDRREVLHVCSGGLPHGEGIRVDIRPEACPDVVADGRALPFADGSHAAALIDPPYTEHYAKDLYGTEYPRPAHLLAEASRVVRPNGRIGFVHYIVPNAPDGCRFIKAFGLSMGFGYPMRAVTIYEREQASLFAGGAR